MLVIIFEQTNRSTRENAAACCVVVYYGVSFAMFLKKNPSVFDPMSRVCTELTRDVIIIVEARFLCMDLCFYILMQCAGWW